MKQYSRVIQVWVSDAEHKKALLYKGRRTWMQVVTGEFGDGDVDDGRKNTV